MVAAQSCWVACAKFSVAISLNAWQPLLSRPSRSKRIQTNRDKPCGPTRPRNRVRWSKQHDVRMTTMQAPCLSSACGHRTLWTDASRQKSVQRGDSCVAVTEYCHHVSRAHGKMTLLLLAHGTKQAQLNIPATTSCLLRGPIPDLSSTQLC